MLACVHTHTHTHSHTLTHTHSHIHSHIHKCLSHESAEKETTNCVRVWGKRVGEKKVRPFENSLWTESWRLIKSSLDWQRIKESAERGKRGWKKRTDRGKTHPPIAAGAVAAYGWWGPSKKAKPAMIRAHRAESSETLMFREVRTLEKIEKKHWAGMWRTRREWHWR